jgi:hypothetical protein
MNYRVRATVLLGPIQDTIECHVRPMCTYTAVLAGEGLVFSSSDLSLVTSVTVDWTTLIVVVHCEWLRRVMRALPLSKR